MTDSIRAGTSVEAGPATFFEVKRAVHAPPPIYDVVPGPGEVNGARVLRACRYNFELCAAIFALRDDWKELIASIVSPELMVNVRAITIQIREGLGLPVD